MQNFVDTQTGEPWAFDDDVNVSQNEGVFHFVNRFGHVLAVPTTLQPQAAAGEKAD